MGTGYLADTNAAIDYLENKLAETATAFIDNLEMRLSVVPRIELLAWSNISPQQHSMLNGFIFASQIYNLSEEIILQTIEMRRKHKIKLPDAIIAATAITQNLTLITRSLADFKKIKDLQLVNPSDNSSFK